MSQSISSGSAFATTHWTAVLHAGDPGSPHAARALEELCNTYWYPLYAFVRRRGYTLEDSEDLVQAFFAQLLEKNYLTNLSREKGRFRSFLLAALKHFLANEWDRANRQKRGVGKVPLSMDWEDAENRFRIEPIDSLSPDKLYDRSWAVTLLDRVIVRLRNECVGDGKEKVFDVLKPCLTAGKGAMDYSKAARQLDHNEGAVRIAAHRLRRRYREMLREEISQTLSAPGQVEDELNALFNAFTN